MKRIRGLDELKDFPGAVLSIGNFDGVHLGHRTILSRLVELAHRLGTAAVVLTFEPHPLQLLNPGAAPPRLTTADQKASLIATSGIDLLVEFPTDAEFLNLSPEAFFQRIVLGKFAARGLVEGNNFFFGQGRRGTVETLAAFCREHEMILDVIQPAIVNGVTVSSSLIRRALADGQAARAGQLLGRPYALVGTVRAGAGRGRMMGFPTLNLHQIETLIPADGVYAGRFETTLGDWPAAIHVGPNPTFSDGERKVEAHLLDFSGDLYGQTGELAFFQHIRETRQFSDADELACQLQDDVARVRQIV